MISFRFGGFDSVLALSRATKGSQPRLSGSYKDCGCRIRIPVTEYLLRTTLSPLELAVQFVSEEKVGTGVLCPAAALATGGPVLD
jgi:hypothetical protein